MQSRLTSSARAVAPQPRLATGCTLPHASGAGRQCTARRTCVCAARTSAALLGASAQAHVQVCRARIANVEIPNGRPIRYALRYIYGVGDATACQILAATGIDPQRRTYDLDETEVGQLRQEVDKYTVEGDLRRQVNQNIKRLIDIQCYRGTRHVANLPCRGQKTKNNARTRKGKKSAPVAIGRK